MSFVNRYRSSTVFGELKVQRFNTGNINGLLDISGNTILRGDCIINGNLSATDGTIDISGNLAVTGNISGNVTGTVTNATNVAIGTENTNTSFFPTFVSSTTGNLPLKTDGGLTYNPNSNILSCNVTGNLTGIATNVNVTDVSTNASFSVPFLSASTGSATINSDSGFQYNPSSNVLSVGSVSGSLSGTSTFAQQVIPSENADNVNQRVAFLSAATGSAFVRTDPGLVYNPLNNILTCGQFEGLATNATNVEVSPFSSNASFSIPYTSVASGITPLRTDPGLTYNPSSNIVSCDVNGTALNATNVAIETDATDASFNVVFVSGTSGNLPLKTDGGLIYNPNSNILHTAVSKVDVGSGEGINEDFVIPFIEFDVGQTSFLSSAFIKYNPNTETLKVTQIETGTMNGFSTQVLAGFTTDNSDNPILFFRGTGFDTVNNVEATPFHAPGITYNPSTQTLNVTNINGTITNNASTSTITSVATDASFNVVFVSGSSGNLPLKTDGGLIYNPNSNILSCNVSGNVTGTSSNINITSTGTSTAFRIPFALTGTGSAALGSDSNLNFNPGTNTFSVDNIDADTLYAPSLKAPLSGVWFISGNNRTDLTSVMPLFKSESNFNDINSGLTSGSVSGTTVGTLTNPFDLDNLCDRVIIMPDWGVIAFQDPNFDNLTRINFHNSNSVPIVVTPNAVNSISSARIYYKKVEQT